MKKAKECLLEFTTARGFERGGMQDLSVAYVIDAINPEATLQPNQVLAMELALAEAIQGSRSYVVLLGIARYINTANA